MAGDEEPSKRRSIQLSAERQKMTNQGWCAELLKLQGQDACGVGVSIPEMDINDLHSLPFEAVGITY